MLSAPGGNSLMWIKSRVQALRLVFQDNTGSVRSARVGQQATGHGSAS
jgi:hypothetical protein